LIDQIVRQPKGPIQNVHEKEFRKCRIVVDGADNRSLFQPHNQGFRHGRGCRHAQRLADQASLTTEIARLNDCYDGFFALLGNDLDLGSTFLKIKNAIGGIALRIELMLCTIAGLGSLRRT